MNGKSPWAIGVVAAVIIAIQIPISLVVQQKSKAAMSAERAKHTAALEEMQTRLDGLQEKLALTAKERDQYKADAAEVHRLRGELSALRQANDELEKTAARQAKAAAAAVDPAPAPVPVPNPTSTYTEVAQFAGGLRAKMRNGEALTAEEAAWLNQAKPELEKLESNPETFAAFQASMIQAALGITDPQKVERIQQGIQKVYENAVTRGLTLQSRPEEDAAWVQERHQLDRRGTAAVQRILDENERAAFDRAFLGVMGVDLGTGVDKSLYPPGFLGEDRATQ